MQKQATKRQKRTKTKQNLYSTEQKKNPLDAPGLFIRKSDGKIHKKGGILNGKQLYVDVLTGSGVGYVPDEDLIDKDLQKK